MRAWLAICLCAFSLWAQALEGESGMAVAADGASQAVEVSTAVVNPPLITPNPSAKPKPDAETYSSGASIAKVMLGLLVVIAVFLASAWVLKRVQNGINPQHSQMKTLAAMALTSRERVVLVEVAGVQMVLGVAPGSVTALHVFDEPVVDSHNASGEQFAAKLAQFMKQKP